MQSAILLGGDGEVSADVAALDAVVIAVAVGDGIGFALQEDAKRLLQIVMDDGDGACVIVAEEKVVTLKVGDPVGLGRQVPVAVVMDRAVGAKGLIVLQPGVPSLLAGANQLDRDGRFIADRLDPDEALSLVVVPQPGHLEAGDAFVLVLKGHVFLALQDLPVVEHVALGRLGPDGHRVALPGHRAAGLAVGDHYGDLAPGEILDVIFLAGLALTQDPPVLLRDILVGIRGAPHELVLKLVGLDPDPFVAARLIALEPVGAVVMEALVAVFLQVGAGAVLLIAPMLVVRRNGQHGGHLIAAIPAGVPA